MTAAVPHMLRYELRWLRCWKALPTFITVLYAHIFMRLSFSIPKSDDVPGMIPSSATDGRMLPGMIWDNNWKNSAPPHSKSMVLNILVDDNGSCPDGCVFIHKILPPWVQFRYVFFRNHVRDLARVNDQFLTPALMVGDVVNYTRQGERLSFSGVIHEVINSTHVTIMDHDTGKEGKYDMRFVRNFSNREQPYHVGLSKAMENHLGEAQSGHVLILARYHVVEIAQWAKDYKESNNVSVGMFLMGDEELRQHKKLDSANLYENFDYVLRNYFFNASQFGDIPLRFLGNATCGKSLPLPSPPLIPGPTWGLHWLFLQPHKGGHDMLDRPYQSIEPAYMRPRNCSFTGWMGGNRLSKKDRGQVRKLSHKTFRDLNCEIALSVAFAKNKYNRSKLQYLSNDLAQSKIGFNPRGVHPECHRLPELLSLGTVPAMTHQEYMHYTFQPIPGIIEDDWVQVFSKMRYYLVEGIDELSTLSYEGAKWLHQLEECVKSDVDLILRGAFGMK